MQYKKEGPEMKKDCAAIVLAAGRGKRMRSEVPKQYLMLEDKPIIYYALKVFQESFYQSGDIGDRCRRDRIL